MALTDTEKALVEANIEGSRETLRVDSAIPATMAVIYLLMFIYFQAIGGYKAVHVGDELQQAKMGAEPAALTRDLVDARRARVLDLVDGVPEAGDASARSDAFGDRGRGGGA